MHDAHPGAPVTARFGGGEASAGPFGLKFYGGQPERAGHQATDGRVERFAGYGRHHLAEGDEARVRVADPGSGRGLQRGLAQVAEQVRARAAPAVELAAAGQAGGVREQVRDRDARVPQAAKPGR